MAPLVLLAVLLCHGFLGALHQTCDSPVHSHLAGAHLVHTPSEDPGGHPEGMHLGCSDYAAVLISMLFGAVVGLLLKGVRAWGTLVVPPLLWRFSQPIVPHPPRGPTTTVLQVFRL